MILYGIIPVKINYTHRPRARRFNGVIQADKKHLKTCSQQSESALWRGPLAGGQHGGRKRRRAALLMVAALLVGAASLAQAVTLEQIKNRGGLRIAVANEIPYGYVDLRGKPQGVGPDVAQRLAKQLGIKKIEWISTTFSALIPGL